jgi:hypothetical protein
MIMDLLVAGAIRTFLLEMLLKRNMFIIFDITVRLYFDIFLLFVGRRQLSKRNMEGCYQKSHHLFPRYLFLEAPIIFSYFQKTPVVFGIYESPTVVTWNVSFFSTIFATKKAIF